MTHRIREAMSDPIDAALKGDVEADETYVGGKPRPYDGKVHPRGRGTTKTPVALVVERNGESTTKVVPATDGKNLKAFICENVDPSATIITDEHGGYYGIGQSFAGHEVVNHNAKQYARHEHGRSINTNTAESWFALLKRGHYGVYHQMSRKHLGRYCDEFGFRWDHRRVSDSECTEAAIAGAEGKRLTYKELVGLG